MSGAMNGNRGDASPRVVIIDDEEIAREALRVYMEADGIHVVGMTGDGVSGLAMVRDERPDVALVDLGLPDLSGVEVTASITSVAPETQVLVITGSESERDILEAVRAGACGYLPKSATATEVAKAARRVSRGEPALSDRIVGGLMKAIRDGNGACPDAVTLCSSLSSRELEILTRVAAGMDNADIALELYLSPHTVKNHVAHILRKLKLENRVQAAAQAVRAGLV